MIRLSLKDDGAFLGSIDEEELQLLIDQLEEESETDTDYFISAETIDLLEQRGASAHLVGMLRRAVGSSEGVEIVWEES
jgi:hypothetical protein